MLKKAWMMARTEIPMVFKSRYVKMVPVISLIMSIAFGGVMTYFILALGGIDALYFNLMMSSVMGVVIILLPVMLPISIAADSIVGEKERHTLVPLLATPLSDGELLLGKFLTALIPGIIVSYGNLLLAIAMVNGVVLFMNPSFLWVWPDLLSLIQAIIMPLLFTFFAVGIMVVISQRAKTVYDAYQTGGVIVLPAMVFAYSGFLQGTGWNWIIFFVGVLALIIVDLLVFRIALKTFNRDVLISRTG